MRALFEAPTPAGWRRFPGRGSGGLRGWWRWCAGRGAVVVCAAAVVVYGSVGGSVPTYNIPVVVRLRGRLDVAALGRRCGCGGPA